MSDVNDQQQEQLIDEGGGEDGSNQPDPITNLKGEMNRKLDGYGEKFAVLAKQLETMQAALISNSRQQQQQQEPQTSLRDLMVDDADAAARVIEERAVRRANAVVDDRMNRMQSAQTATMDIIAKYPEFSENGSEAAKLAISKAATLPEHLRGTPEGVKMVMLEAASELGLVPAKARSQQQQSQGRNSDDFSIGGQSQGSGTRTQRRQDPTKTIDPRTLEFAKLLNPKIADDPKRLEALATASQRKRWNQYE